MVRIRLWGVVMGMLLLAAGQAGAASVQAIDQRGHMVRLPAPAQRVVSLLPSLTETVCVLGACERLVATDRWSNWPASVQLLPKAGGLDDANVEMIASLKPDLVLAARSSRVAERLQGLGIAVAVFEPENLAGMQRVFTGIATLLGTGNAAQKWQALNSEMKAAAAAVPPPAQGVRVYFEVEASPFAAGESSFIGETLAMLGARNVVPAALGPFPKLNPEYVVKADPDLIIVSASRASGLAQRPGWASMRAVKQRDEGGVCTVPEADFDMLVRPGPRMGQAALVLADCLVKAPVVRSRRTQLASSHP